MVKSGQKKESPVKDNSTAYYLYLITSSGGVMESASLPVAIEDGAAFEWITVGSLAALASKVSLTDYNEESLAKNLTDATWTALRAMRHEHVVEYFTKRASVIPLRFGSIYLERSSVERMLSEKTDELSELLERLQGKVEWGVNVYCDRNQLLDGITSVSQKLRELLDQAKKASPGQAYLLKKKIETLKTDEARVELARIVDQVEQDLSKVSDETKRLRILKVEATEFGELKGKFAFLIDRDGFDEFRDEAERLAQEFETAGIKLELTGPWPVYNFTG
jgi:hypothetical protein